jgi:hypothetical protein
VTHAAPLGAPAVPAPAGDADLHGKEAALIRTLEEFPSLIVAYSGGVDSA